MTKKHESLAEALAAAQAEMTNVGKNAENSHYRNEYADLSAVRDAVIPHLAKHGIACVQSVNGSAAEDSATIVTTIYFGAESLEVARCSVSLAAEKVKAPGIGKASSYLRRYQLAGLGSVAQTDDPGDTDYAAEAKEAEEAERAQRTAQQQYRRAKRILHDDVGCDGEADADGVIRWVTGGCWSLKTMSEDPGDVLAALQEKNGNGTPYSEMIGEAAEAARLEALIGARPHPISAADRAEDEDRDAEMDEEARAGKSYVETHHGN